MPLRKPLVLINGAFFEMPAGDVIPLELGGTGATTVAGARSALGLGGLALLSAVSDAEITGLNWAKLANVPALAAAVHGHAVADVTGLQAALDAKAGLAGAAMTGGFTWANPVNNALYMSGVFSQDGSTGNRVFWQQNFQFANSLNGTSFDTGISQQIKYRQAAGTTNSGYFKGAGFELLRNYTGAAGGNDSGTVATLYGALFTAGHYNTDATSSPQTTTVRVLHLGAYALTGNITDLTALYINNPSGAGYSNAWGFQVGTAYKNYIGGTLLVGTTVNNGVEKIQLAGDFSATGYIKAAALKVAANQVVGARVSGWTAPTLAAASRGAFAADTTYTASAVYTQSEISTIATDLKAFKQRYASLESDLRTHGLIGT